MELERLLSLAPVKCDVFFRNSEKNKFKTWNCKLTYAWLAVFFSYIMLDLPRYDADILVIIIQKLSLIVSGEYVKCRIGKSSLERWQSNLTENSNLMDIYNRGHPSTSWWSEARFFWHVTEKLNILLLKNL